MCQRQVTRDLSKFHKKQSDRDLSNKKCWQLRLLILTFFLGIVPLLHSLFHYQSRTEYRACLQENAFYRLGTHQ